MLNHRDTKLGELFRIENKITPKVDSCANVCVLYILFQWFIWSLGQELMLKFWFYKLK